MMNHRIENRMDGEIDNIAKTEKWSDFYGCTATITVCTDGRANLAIRTSRGSLVHAKTYGTYRGAKIAMGKASDCWSLTTMVN